MLIAKGKYLGSLRNELVHLKSSQQIYTDAPTDNNGKGEQFSPTDLLAVALASCMVTIMGIWGDKNDKSIGQIAYTVEKVMNVSPRKVNTIKIVLTIQNELTEQDNQRLEVAARNCPVALSLSSDLNQELVFKYV